MNPYLAGDYFAAAGWGLYGWSLANSATDSKIVGKADVGLLYGEANAGSTQRNVFRGQWNSNQ